MNKDIAKGKRQTRERPLIAFFDYHDVFEDFYPHYSVDQKSFATQWADTGNHGWISLIQRNIGDVVWYMLSLSPELTEAKHKVVGCRIKILPTSWAHRKLWKAFYLSKHSWRWRNYYPLYGTIASYMAMASRHLIKELKRDQPDIIFVQDYGTGRFDSLILISRAFDIPILTFHSGSQPDTYLGRSLKRWTIPRADWIFPSGLGEQEMLRRRYRVQKERLEIIRPPVDTAIFRPVDRLEACRRANLDPHRRYILFMGRLLDHVKRVSTLIKVFANLSKEFNNLDLLVAGDGPDRLMLENMANRSAPNRIRFLGWVSSAEMKVSLYNSAEFLVLPSRKEGFPVVICEALASGIPVLASNVGSISDLVIDELTGWLVPPGDDEALAAKLSFILNHSEVQNSMRHNARKIAEKHVSTTAVTDVLKKGFSRVGKHFNKKDE